MKDSFKEVATVKGSEKYENAISRKKELYSRNNDIRSEFERDYTRILHSTGFRRMKHKTQVFFSPTNDHICTRIEHVMHVESVSHTIAKYLGLNTELTKAIATAHDIGHSPFGHQGERILSTISQREFGETFWHERNGVEMVDKIELLEDNKKCKQNLNLTYAVRDGIISHCGEIDENNIKPRDEYIDLLKDYVRVNQYAPYTWEGCVVKIADKISYIGRDIEDAITLGILDKNIDELYGILDINGEECINNTVIINNLIVDLCENSSPEKGLCFSDKMFEIQKKLKEYNFKYIYSSEKLKPSNEYFSLVLNTIFNILKESYNDEEKIRKMYPTVYKEFEDWKHAYWNKERTEEYANDQIFDFSDEKQYSKAIILYISGMTDKFAIDTYNKIVGF